MVAEIILGELAGSLSLVHSPTEDLRMLPAQDTNSIA